MRKIFYLFFLTFIACSQDKVEIYNNFEPDPWMNRHTLTDEVARSGVHSSRLNANNIYGFGYNNFFRNISEKEIKQTTVDFWVYAKKPTEHTLMVFNISFEDKHVLWEGINIRIKPEDTQKWIKFSKTFNIDKYYDPDYKLSVYGWSPKGEELFIDDLRLIFN